MQKRLSLIVTTLLLGCLLSFTTQAQQDPPPAGEPPTATDNALDTLGSFVKMRVNILTEIEALDRQIQKAESQTEKDQLKGRLAELQSEFQSTSKNLEIIAAGVDISSLTKSTSEEFDLSKEIFSLLKPALDEMKDMTAHVRQKSELREKITFYQERLQVIGKALVNIRSLLDVSENDAVRKSLKNTEDRWLNQQELMQGELQAARLQLEKLEASETSLTEASQSYLKSFFAKRGRYLGQALLVVLAILLLSRVSYKAMTRYIPGFRKKHRSFRLRVIELMHRFITLILMILGPMVVFYMVEDWLLFSIGLLILLGITLTLRKTLPSYWQQGQLYLNIGSVREGERILLDGLPWQVDQINFFCTLVNPLADLRQRVPISEMVQHKSRPAKNDEPWFPCRKGDWVILNDGVRGKVIGISCELVQLVERGGSQVTYQMTDFLAASPRNLATNFRIKESIGISYELQSQSTNEIPGKLHTYIGERIRQEGYSDQLLNLRVEFEQAGQSSLDLVVIADFRGQLGDLYNRLRRAIQRWCVDACSEHDWLIPFPQLVVHGMDHNPASAATMPENKASG
jgi:hypothetical protein